MALEKNTLAGMVGVPEQSTGITVGLNVSIQGERHYAVVWWQDDERLASIDDEGTIDCTAALTPIDLLRAIATAFGTSNACLEVK